MRNTIESKEEYQANLFSYLEHCRRAVKDSTEAYVDQRIALIISTLESAKVARKLERVMFMKEPGRKLFFYDSFCREPLNWTSMKEN